MTLIKPAEGQQSIGSLYRIFYCCRPEAERFISPTEAGFQIDIANDAKAPFEVVANDDYDLFLLDGDLFGDDIYIVILELKRWDWSLPVIVLTSAEEVVYQTNLIEAGADDILHKKYSPEYVTQRITLCLMRKEQDHRFIQTNRKLYEIMMHTDQLHAFTDPQALIEDTIKVACNMFNLYGVAVAILEDGLMRIYSGNAGDQSETVIVQSLRDTEPQEPLSRSIETGLVELFDDISRDLQYVPLANLPRAQSVLIIPLQHQADILGTLAFFEKQDCLFNPHDLRTYEILTAQFTLALKNAYFSRAQHQDIRTNHLLLNAWQSIFKAEATEEIAKTLCSLVAGLPSVDEAMVWIAETETTQLEVFTSGKYENVREILSELLTQGDILESLLEANHEPHMISKFGLSPTDRLQPLFRALYSRQLIFTPLKDSARLIGGILASGSGDRRFDLEDANRVKNLALATGQALERIMLIEATTEKSGRLEAILRSVTEGIFFVDDNGQVGFCNPQVTELTNVNPSEVIGKEPDVLLDLLAAQATDPEKAALDLHEAVHSLGSLHGSDRNYPIVELTLRDSGQQVDVELVAIDDYRASVKSWVGLVRLDSRPGSKWGSPVESIDLLVRALHASSIDLRRIIESSAKGRNRSSGSAEKSVLQEIKRGITSSEALLEQYARLNNLDLSEPQWNYETVDLGELLQDIVRVHFPELQTRIVSDATAGRFCVESDKQLVEQGVSRLLQNIVKRTHDIVNVHMKDAGDEILVRFEASGMFDLPDSELTLFHLVELDDPEHQQEDMYLYLSLMQFYHCRFSIETAPDRGRSLLIVFPKAQGGFTLPAHGDGVYSEAVSTARTPRREPEAVMLIQGRSAITKRVTRELERENVSIYIYRSPEEALRDLNLTRLDLIVLDGSLTDEDSTRVCEKIHNRSEVPIVIVADKAANLERVEALNAGAEDYITEPISEEELLAKINVMFKRQHLAERTEQPLDLGDLRIDFARRAVFINHKPVLLTRIEYDLLRTLVVNMGQVLTHQQLLEKVWGPEHRSETQYLWVHLSRLRKKLEPTSYIRNQQGIGYIFQNN